MSDPFVAAVTALVLFLIGASLGSFLNVALYRIRRGLSVNRPTRSFCPRCGHQIRWHDNIPFFSWLWLRGRCRDCRAAIPISYWLVETVCGAFALTVFLSAGFWPAVASAILFPIVLYFVLRSAVG